MRTDSRASTLRSPKRSAEARWPATFTGWWIPLNRSSPSQQSWLIRWTSSRRRLAWKPTSRRAGRFFSRLPMAKSLALLIVVSVRRARFSLWYCLTRVLL